MLGSYMVLWMGSGFVFPAETPMAEQGLAPKAVAVRVVTSTAAPVDQVFVAEGEAIPDRDTMILAEAGGQISEVSVAKGESVSAGQQIAVVEQIARRADLDRAEEGLRRAERENENAQTLLNKGVSTMDRVAQSRADLAAAEASVVTARQALQNTIIRAPFDGRVEDLTINTGELVADRGEVGRLVDNTPLTIQIQVPQQALLRISAGLAAQVRFITGEEVDGIVRYVGSSVNCH